MAIYPLTRANFQRAPSVCSPVTPPHFNNTLVSDLLCVRHKLPKCRFIFQLIYRVNVLATLENSMGSLMVLFLQLPARAGTMGYAEYAVHEDPQRKKGPRKGSLLLVIYL